MSLKTKVSFWKTPLMVIFASLIPLSISFAQTNYQYSVGTAGLDMGQSIALYPDGNLLIGGQTQKIGADQFDMLLLKMDQQGGVLWSNTYGAKESEIITYVRPISDGILIAAEKYRLNTAEGENLLLVKTNQIGDIVWKKVYHEGAGESEGYSFMPTPDGGFLITGIRKGLVTVSSAFYTMKEEKQSLYLIKIDANGNKLWSKVYSNPDKAISSIGMSIKQLKDGNFVIAGNIANGNIGTDGEQDIESRNLLLLKVDQNGTLLWTREYVSPDMSLVRDIAVGSAGQMIITGEAELSNSENTDVLLISLSADGQVAWAKTFGGANYESGASVQVTADGGALVAGVTRSFGGGLDDGLLLKVDGLGRLEWAKAFGTEHTELFNQMIKTTDGYMLTGATMNPDNTYMDVYLVKTDAQGNTPCNGTAANMTARQATITPKKAAAPKLIDLDLEVSDETNTDGKLNADFILKVSCDISVENICR